MVVSHRAAAARASLRRLVLVAGLCLTLGLSWSLSSASSAEDPGRQPVPAAVCGPGSLPETSTQGRVPESDYTSGRYAQGYLCNTEEVAQEGVSGGFKALRYTDSNSGFYVVKLTNGVQNLLH